MGDASKAMKFEDQKLPDLDDYARLAEQFIPGRQAIFAIVEASLIELLADGPQRILVVGAGGGEDILRLGRGHADWSFVGVDTYEPMVDLARRRIGETPLAARSQVVATPIDALDDTGFDAATCILTAHFVPDDGSKLAFFKAIRDRLKPEAALAIVDGVGVAGEPQTELLRRIWQKHAILNGVAPDLAASNAENFKKVAVVSEERQVALLTEAGFKNITPIFQGLAIKGWIAFASSSEPLPQRDFTE